MSWKDLITRLLPGAEAVLVNRIWSTIRQGLGKPLADELAPVTNRAAVKSIDKLAASLALLVHRGDLTAEEATELMAHWIAAAEAEAMKMTAAADAYAPKALAVELAKAKGSDPGAARAERKAALMALRAEGLKLLESIFGVRG
jgi:hypothetical protein